MSFPQILQVDTRQRDHKQHNDRARHCAYDLARLSSSALCGVLPPPRIKAPITGAYFYTLTVTNCNGLHQNIPDGC